MSEDQTYRIRPAGRHILTIGKDLIQDRYAAIVELVKNAYDADSPDVNIEFLSSIDRNRYDIVIEDHGHGMSRETVINKWMVPSTNDKLKRRTSPNERIMQGQKGIGRYAASLLGKDLLLETVSQEGEKTTVFLEWDSFEKAQYLEDVEVLIETEKTNQKSGTKLTISGDGASLSEWNSEHYKKLKFELRKLISPLKPVLVDGKSEDEFKIKTMRYGFFEKEEGAIEEIIEPLPLFDYFDYRIAGKIDVNGNGLLSFTNQRARNTIEEQIDFCFNSPTGCGELSFDIRVYDRDPEAIESLIGRGLKDESGNKMGKNEARKLLDDCNGIGVYRNGFRIRPLGDAEFDWLKLNEKRIQNPSMKIGSNQVIGIVLIESEEKSKLIEKSARDGLQENEAFSNLKKITLDIISKLEVKRFSFRQKAGLGRVALKTEKELTRLLDYNSLKTVIGRTLIKDGISEEATKKIIGLIEKEEIEKNRIVEDVRQAVAVYQGQATLGKIINVILHEGRKPLAYFKNKIPHLQKWAGVFLKTGDSEKLQQIVQGIEGIAQNADFFSTLFARLDPLGAGKRTAKEEVLLKKAIDEVTGVFETELKNDRIAIKVVDSEGLKFLSWPQDIYAIFTNLIENSIYWMREKKAENREITITITAENGVFQYIDYQDTGPGIEPELIESEIIFEPQFSTKPEGTGLGLAIAGEAATRNGLTLKALESDEGAHFRLQQREMP